MLPTLQKLNIKLVLFDLDDTLLNTHIVFKNNLENIQQKLADTAGVSFEEFNKDFVIAELKARELHYVNPLPLWSLTMELLSQKYLFLTQEYQTEIVHSIMTAIYTSPITIKQGALELLTELKKAKVLMGIVTNASQEWTDFKISQAGFNKFFKKDSIKVIPPHIRKGMMHWQSSIEKFKVSAQNTLIIGDNFKADIMPAIELGAYAIYLLEPDGWNVHAEGNEELNRPRVKEVSSLSLVATMLLEF